MLFHRPDDPTQLDTAHGRHVNIQDKRVDAVRMDYGQGLLTTTRLEGVYPRAAQLPGQQHAQHAHIVGD